jgi:hypothetical protein
MLEAALGDSHRYPLWRQVSSQLFNESTYKVGGYSKEYTLKQEGLLEKVEVSRPNLKLIEGYRRALSTYWIKNSTECASNWELMLQLTVDRKAARKAIDENYPLEAIRGPLEGLDIDYLVSLHQKASIELRGYSKQVREATAIAAKRQAALDDLKIWSTKANSSERARNLFIKLDAAKTGRIYSTFTGTSKVIRRHLKLDRQRLRELDISKSHPTLLVYIAYLALFERVTQVSHRNKGTFSNLVKEKDTLEGVIREVSNPKREGESPRGDRQPCIVVGKSNEFKRFLSVCGAFSASEGLKKQEKLEEQLYKSEANYQRHNAKRVTAKRENYRFKKLIYLFLYADPESGHYRNSYAIKWIRKQYPNLAALLHELKTSQAFKVARGIDAKGASFPINVAEKPYSALPIKLMRIEAALMRYAFEGLEVLHLHDAVLYSRKQAEKVEARLNHFPEVLTLKKINHGTSK